ncbi:MAG: peptide MFS transporter [Flavobacteriaceae bacterium]|jgi:POT family proton-dependent oligopeptide transporter|nr:peptide MFS transporter [Flavobacteriaceae bacterium]
MIDIQTQPTLSEIQNFKGKYPKQIWSLFFTEMWERFCFYGNRGMLSVFMTDILLMTKQESSLKYGAIQAFVYAFTFLGGLFADKILGFRKSLFWGGLLMIVGSFLLGADAQKFFYFGICLIIVGTGFFKPNISTMVGELYHEGDIRRQAGFNLFYSGINIGALIGGAVCVSVGKMYSWNLAFSLSGIFMVIGLITFYLSKKNLGTIGLQPQNISKNKNGKIYEIGVYVLSLLSLPFVFMMIRNTDYTDLFMYIVGPLTLIYLFYEMSKLKWTENRKLLAALIFITFSIFFWAFFEQAGGSLSLFAKDNLHTNLLFLNIDPNVVNNGVNSVFVIIFSPLVGLLWLALAKRKIEPNAIVKFGLGFLFLAGAFFTFYYTRFFMTPDGKTSLNIFALAYLIITFGELCLSPIGLSLMTQLSPKKLWGVMMGMWFLASAYGQYAAGILGAEMAAKPNATLAENLFAYTSGYKQLSFYALILGIVLIAISPLVKKLMGKANDEDKKNYEEDFNKKTMIYD